MKVSRAQLLDSARGVVAALQRGSLRAAFAESCTGGLAAEVLTRVPGASGVFELGIVTYSNRMKRELLDVPGEILASDGAVSAACVRAMAEGIRRRSGASYGMALSGISGPGGGSPDKPVGTVYIGLAGPKGSAHEARYFPYTREENREASVYAALAMLMRSLSGDSTHDESG